MSGLSSFPKRIANDLELGGHVTDRRRKFKVTTNTQNKETCVAASYDVLANLTLSKPPRRTPKVWRRSRAFGFASAVTRTTTASSTTVSGQRYQPESRCFSMHRQRIRPYAKGSRVIRANRSSVEMKPVARASRVVRSDQRRTLRGTLEVARSE